MAETLLYGWFKKTDLPKLDVPDVIQLIIKKHQLPLIVVDIEIEEIRQWIN
jgi:hypothetical protein